MELAIVLGQVVATTKCQGMPKERLLLVDFVDPEGARRGAVHVAVDAVGAGNGEWVLVARGSSARNAFTGRDALPVDLSIVGIIDEIVVQDRLTYRK